MAIQLQVIDKAPTTSLSADQRIQNPTTHPTNKGITIWLNGAHVGNEKKFDWLVGQKAYPSATWDGVQPAGGAIAWSWDIPNKNASAWLSSKTSPELKYPDSNVVDPSFYFYTHGLKTITVTGRAPNGETRTTMVELNVLKPDIALNQHKNQAPAWSADANYGQNNGSEWLHLGTGAPTVNAGIFVEITNAQQINGDFEWVQYAWKDVWAQSIQTGNWQQISHGDGLDNGIKTGPTFGDSPGVKFNGSMVGLTVSNTFLNTVMYKPKGKDVFNQDIDGEFVPMKQFSWSWYGAAWLDGNTWKPVGSPAPATINDPIDTTEYPTWSDVLDG